MRLIKGRIYSLKKKEEGGGGRESRRGRGGRGREEEEGEGKGEEAAERHGCRSLTKINVSWKGGRRRNC